VSSVAARPSGRSRVAMTMLANGARALTSSLSLTQRGTLSYPAAASLPGEVCARQSSITCASIAAPNFRRARSARASGAISEPCQSVSRTPSGVPCRRTSTRADRQPGVLYPSEGTKTNVCQLELEQPHRLETDGRRTFHGRGRESAPPASSGGRTLPSCLWRRQSSDRLRAGLSPGPVHEDRRGPTPVDVGRGAHCAVEALERSGTKQPVESRVPPGWPSTSRTCAVPRIREGPSRSAEGPRPRAGGGTRHAR
jgi:hypothetical protein